MDTKFHTHTGQHSGCNILSNWFTDRAG